jgi:fatty-acyl-CoA synthase
VAGLLRCLFGAQYAGLLPVPVSIPVGIGGKDAYLDQLRRQFAASGASLPSASTTSRLLAEAAQGVSRGCACTVAWR